MGLDNIPYEYPCRSRGTATLVPVTDKDGNPLMDGGGTRMRIDCSATMKSGGCPWKEAYESSGLPEGGRAVGMFGTECWYRGKYGEWLLEVLGVDNEDTTFYGDNEDGTYKSPPSCVALADSIDERIADRQTIPDPDGDGDLMPDMRYASWYLRWAAANCGGLTCWY